MLQIFRHFIASKSNNTVAAAVKMLFRSFTVLPCSISIHSKHFECLLADHAHNISFMHFFQQPNTTFVSISKHKSVSVCVHNLINMEQARVYLSARVNAGINVGISTRCIRHMYRNVCVRIRLGVLRCVRARIFMFVVQFSSAVKSFPLFTMQDAVTVLFVCKGQRERKRVHKYIISMEKRTGECECEIRKPVSVQCICNEILARYEDLVILCVFFRFAWFSEWLLFLSSRHSVVKQHSKHSHTEQRLERVLVYVSSPMETVVFPCRCVHQERCPNIPFSNGWIRVVISLISATKS